MGSLKKGCRACQNRGRQTHTSKPGGPHPKFQLPTRGNLRSPRSPSPPSMCGGDSSAPHVHLLPPHRGSSPAGCPKDRHPFRGRIWQHALGERNGVKPCASPSRMQTESATGSLNWSIFSHFLCQHGGDICLLSETFLNPEQTFRLAKFVCHRTDRPTARGGRAIVVRRGIVHHSVPVLGPDPLELGTRG